MRYAETSGDIPASDVTAELFASISELLINTAQYLKEKYDAPEIYMAGGVASSRTFRAIVQNSNLSNMRFGAPELSGDNATGSALLAKRVYETGNRFSGK